MSDGMEIDGDIVQDPVQQQQQQQEPPPPLLTGPAMSASTSTASYVPPTAREPREPFREIPVKVHIRRPDKDHWTYLGRGVVSFEPNALRAASRVVVRAAATQKVMCIFDETYEIQAEKRGNFVVISSVEGARVVSWSLNALNNTETLRLLTIIELACPFSGKVVADPSRPTVRTQRRTDRVIKEDRRRRHKRRKDADSLVDAFARSTLDHEGAAQQESMSMLGGTPLTAS